MPYEDGRRTACISSQAGCAMGCVFCATGASGPRTPPPPKPSLFSLRVPPAGQMGFFRQLSAAEIFEQVLGTSDPLIAFFYNQHHHHHFCRGHRCSGFRRNCARTVSA